MSITNNTATEVSVEFANTYLHFTVEVGTGANRKPDRVTIIGENKKLLLVESGQVRFYLDPETAVSLGNALKVAAALA